MDKKLGFLIFFLVVLIIGSLVLLKYMGSTCASIFVIMMLILGIFTECEIDQEEKCQ